MLSSQTRAYPRTPIVQEVSTQAEVASGRFKVVIAYYQREPGILMRAVRSALEQRVEELEVIVVDDESPVPAETELAGLTPEERTRVRILTRENGGPGQARNTALEVIGSDADFVAFLDSDDTWSPDHLTRAGLAFERGYEVYFSNWYPLETDEDAYSFFERDLPTGGELIPGSSLFAYAGDFVSQELSQPLARLSTLVFDWKRFRDLRFELDLRHASEDRLFRAKMGMRQPRIAFSMRPECESGEGVNVFSSSHWGSEEFFNTASDQVVALRMAARSLNLSREQRATVKQSLRKARADLASSWLHYLRRHPVRGFGWLGQLTSRDLSLYWAMPIGVLRTIFRRSAD